MPLINYKEKAFREDTYKVIDSANDIIEDFGNKGFTLTLRQLYYQLVARILIPNNERSYKRLGSIINDARMAGLIDWDMIEDRTRRIHQRNRWDNPGEIVRAAAHGYHIDLWEDQKCRIEVWIEKEALIGVIEKVCRKNDVPYFACRGYASASSLWQAVERLKEYQYQSIIILYLGDHDPSGLDMINDLHNRIDTFSGHYDQKFSIRHVALSLSQVNKYNLPSNPTKIKDSRAVDYMTIFGIESWELDALEPDIIVGLIENEINTFRDEGKWVSRLEKETDERAKLHKFADTF